MSDDKKQPHSKTVRGTMSNPKTKEAMKNKDKPRSMLGDPGSLKAEKTDSNPVPGKANQDGGTVDLGSNSNAADVDSNGPMKGKEENKNFDPRKYREEQNQTGSGSGSSSSQPHSAKVRGTLGNEKTREATKQGDMPPGAGDPTSLKKEKNDDCAKSKL